jgi:cephalosporin-C deacetylase-like acetyl esterase
MKKLVLIFFMVTVIFSAIDAQEYSFNLKSNRPDCIFKLGDSIEFTVELRCDGQPLLGHNIVIWSYENNKLQIKTYPSDAPVTITMQPEAPGWYRIQCIGQTKDGKHLVSQKDGKVTAKNLICGIGALVEPLNLQPATPPPEDFDAFWRTQLEALRKIPLNPVIKDIAVDGTPKKGALKGALVTIDCGKDIRPVNGILVMRNDAQPKSLPITLSLPGAGVQNPPKPLMFGGKHQTIFFNMNVHGLPNDQPPEFYQQLRTGELKYYQYINNSDREQYYMKGVILRVVRALDFLKTLPEWDGKNIIIEGRSQGGALAVIAAALDSQVTHIKADVPAMCDFGAPIANRMSAWPKPYEKKKDGSLAMRTIDNPALNQEAKVPADPAVINAMAYFDSASFAERIKNAEVELRCGGRDGTCPPSAIFALYNNLGTDNKKIRFSPLSEHNTFIKSSAVVVNSVIRGNDEPVIE